jgi:hypothetical protein
VQIRAHALAKAMVGVSGMLMLMSAKAPSNFQEGAAWLPVDWMWKESSSSSQRVSARSRIHDSSLECVADEQSWISKVL